MRIFRAASWMVVSLVGVLVLVRMLGGGGVAPTPAVFKDDLSIAMAGKLSDESGKPVLAFFTADWCGPCQVLKRTSLVDPRVEELIKKRMLAVYINGDQQRELVALARVRGYPATMVLIQGKEVARVEGVLRPDEYLNWLTNAVDQATSETPFPGRSIQSPETTLVQLW